MLCRGVCFCLSFLMIVVLTTLSVCAQQTTHGKDFYLTFLPNYHDPGSTPNDSLYIYVVADAPTSGTLSYNDGTISINQNFTIANPANIFVFAVFWPQAEIRGYNEALRFGSNDESETILRRSFHVVSTENVSVYALNQANRTSDAALIFPTPALGTEYFVMSYKADGRVTGGRIDANYTPSEFAIVATQDNTSVIIYPTAPTSITGTQTKSITLNKGQVFYCESEFSLSQLNYDLSGTRIVANAPVAVFAGHQRCLLPIEDKAVVNSRDHLYEQMPPSSVLGKNYIITPLNQPIQFTTPAGAYDIFRVVATEDNTQLRFNNIVLGNLMAGQVYEGRLNTAGLLTASRKVLVAIFKHSSGYGNITQSGDPFMLIVPPRSQYLKQYRFSNCAVGSSYIEHYITVISTRSNVPNIKLDGATIKTTFIDIPNTCYAYANVGVSAGTHTLDSPWLVGLYAYGYGDVVSYGYVGGMAFVPDVSDDAVMAGPDQAICIGDSVQLSSSGRAISLRWSKLGVTSRFPCDTCSNVWVQPNQSTSYSLVATDSLGCTVIDTLNITVNQIPTVDATPDTVICTDVPVVLKANGKYQDAFWSPPTGLSCTTCANTVANPGRDMKYYVTVRNGTNARCSAIDSVTIRYRPGIADAFPKPVTICRGDSTALHIKYGGRVRWTPAVGLNCASCLDVIASPSKTTRYTIQADSASCYSQATVDVIVNDPPTLKMVHDTTICRGDSLHISIQTDASSVLWSPSRYLSTTNATVIDFAPDSDVVYTLRATNSSKCEVIDTLRVRVKPAPQVSLVASDTVVCRNSLLEMKANISGADAVSWSPASAVSCDTCTSTMISTDSDRVYTVTATVGGGCPRSSSIRVHVLDLPSVQLTLHDSSLCQQSTVQLHAQSTESVRWNPSIGLSCSNCPDPVATLSSDITYYAHVGNNQGCSAVDSVHLRVLPTPNLVLSIDRDTLCLSSGVAHISISDGTVGASYQWQADPGLSCYDCANPTARPAQTTTYHLTVISAGGCRKDTSVTIAVKACQRQVSIQNVDAGSFIACSTKAVGLVVSNEGELAVKIDSIFELQAFGAHVILDTSVHLPIVLNPGESMTLPATFVPLQLGLVSVVYGVRCDVGYANADTVIHMKFSAITLNRPLSIKLRSNTVESGKKFALPIEAQSANWSEIGLTDIGLRVGYNKNWMRFLDSVQLVNGLNDLGWTVRSAGEKSNDTLAWTDLEFHGTTPLSTSGVIATAWFSSLLSKDFSFTPTIDSTWFPAQAICIDAQGSSEELVPQGCVRSLRRVEFGQNASTLRSVQPNPVSLSQELSIRYDLAFDAEVELMLIDELGRERLCLLRSVQSSGEYELNADIHSLNSGVYLCRYRASGYEATMPFIVLP